MTMGPDVGRALQHNTDFDTKSPRGQLGVTCRLTRAVSVSDSGSLHGVSQPCRAPGMSPFLWTKSGHLLNPVYQFSRHSSRTHGICKTGRLAGTQPKTHASHTHWRHVIQEVCLTCSSRTDGNPRRPSLTRALMASDTGQRGRRPCRSQVRRSRAPSTGPCVGSTCQPGRWTPQIQKGLPTLCLLPPRPARPLSLRLLKLMALFS